jgi:hypothetical protein
MADRYPLIFDLSDNKFKELIPGDNLDLTGSGIVNANSISTDGIISGRVRCNVYTGNAVSGRVDLTALDANKVVLVNTSSGAPTNLIILPAGSDLEVGDYFKFIDVGTGAVDSPGNSSVNPIYVRPVLFGTDRIMGGPVSDSLVIDSDGESVTLIWCGPTYQWRILN